MDKFALFVVLIIFQTADLTLAASYLLHLRNGNVLQTSYYWEEGNEIKFYVYGGVAGIQKEFIADVTITKSYPEEELGTKKGSGESRPPGYLSNQKFKEIPGYQSGENDHNSEGNLKKGEDVDTDYYRRRKAVLREKLEDALQRNREATARKDYEAKEQTRNEYLEFSKQIIYLGDELKKKNKNVLPDWWEE